MSKIRLGIKLWGGRRYVTEVEVVTYSLNAIFLALGLTAAQNATVIIDLDSGRYLKNRASTRTVADTLDTVVYYHGNAREVTVEELQEAVDELYRNR